MDKETLDKINKANWKFTINSEKDVYDSDKMIFDSSNISDLDYFIENRKDLFLLRILPKNDKYVYLYILDNYDFNWKFQTQHTLFENLIKVLDIKELKERSLNSNDSNKLYKGRCLVCDEKYDISDDERIELMNEFYKNGDGILDAKVAKWGFDVHLDYYVYSPSLAHYAIKYGTKSHLKCFVNSKVDYNENVFNQIIYYENEDVITAILGMAYYRIHKKRIIQRGFQSHLEYFSRDSDEEISNLANKKIMEHNMKIIENTMDDKVMKDSYVFKPRIK